MKMYERKINWKACQPINLEIINMASVNFKEESMDTTKTTEKIYFK